MIKTTTPGLINMALTIDDLVCKEEEKEVKAKMGG